jgi:hypothetical protein
MLTESSDAMSFRKTSANACNRILIVATLQRQPQFFHQCPVSEVRKSLRQPLVRTSETKGGTGNSIILGAAYRFEVPAANLRQPVQELQVGGTNGNVAGFLGLTYRIGVL